MVWPANEAKCCHAAGPMYTSPPSVTNFFLNSSSFGLGVGSSTTSTGVKPLELKFPTIRGQVESGVNSEQRRHTDGWFP